MNADRKIRLGLGLILLLIYQWILVLISLASFTLIIPPLWGIAMGFASVEIMRRRPRGFLIGMICHLLLEVVGWLIVLPIVAMFVRVFMDNSLDKSSSAESRGWAGLVMMFALMWLPFLSLSAWAYFYLRRLRKNWSPNSALQPATPS